MKIALIKYSLESLRNRKLRSFLTIISVLIGIAAVTTLISFGYGISSYVATISEQMGQDKLIVQARGFLAAPVDSNIKFDDTDLKTIEKVNGVDEAVGAYVVVGEIEHDKQKKYGYVIGLDYKEHEKLVNDVYNLKLIEGKKLKGDEKGKAIFGYNYQFEDKVFSKPLKLRDKVTINGQVVEVAGFYDEIGNPQDDSNIYMNLKAMEELFGSKSYYNIIVRAKKGIDPNKVVEDVREKLRDKRHQKAGNEDFFVQTFEQVIAIFTSILNIITGAVILIALISIFVAAVNIMNTMYTSTLERTKEIGVFKAIGSSNFAILFIFVLESCLLSLFGGLIGIGLGYYISQFAGKIISDAGYAAFSPVFTWQLTVGALAFSLLIGFISGIIPAYQASKLKPVDALRYE